MHSIFRNSRIKTSQGMLFWREIGEGTPIIFLHGTWKDSSQWISVMEMLAQDFHCFAPDLLGFGESDFPNVHYSIDLQVECLAQLLQALKRALKQERVYLVGDSLGSWIAASYALKYPEQINGLVLLAPEGVEIQGQKKRWEKMQRIANRPPLVFQLLRLFRPLMKIFGLDQNIKQDWQFHQVMQQYPTACELIFQRQHLEIQAELLHDELSFITVPVLILQGEKDNQEAIAMSQLYAQYMPHAKLKIVASTEENLPESCSSAVGGDIRNFINSKNNAEIYYS
ncbi:alpha/beta hydrolase [Brasilonema octagenarum UFV-E1]|uniref:Alpha/beta hydrolase n=1 Tax=Brasilonema sennae CENA114 TaxID=415709 RepID=A0A856MLQ1_9CYAN|nr:alpha/beta hydrolase [Brasilonema sennae]QDL11472.1 alpha/beta hydrolase [Brasilonema sennae CENA114]QDL17855.1 alpha/beta hydrolase [Brasilonema octagenarum UFV-E1]